MEIFKMSMSASVLILLMIVIRPAVKNRVPGSVLTFLWGIVCCKLMIPSAFFSALGKIGKAAAASVYVPARTADFAGTLDIPDMPDIPVGIRLISARAPQTDPRIWHGVWLAGTVCLTLYFVYTYIRCIRIFRQSLPVERDLPGDGWQGRGVRRNVRIRVSDRIASPLTYGVIHPVIILPKRMDWDNRQGLEYILAHELAHIKRWDALGKICLAAVFACHWFNPLVWGMYFLANRDIELACDEWVIRAIGNGKRASYAGTLLEWEAKRSEVNLLASCFMQHFMKERIMNIMRKKKITIMGIVLSFVLIAGAIVVYAATPAEEEAAGADLQQEQAAADNSVTMVSEDGGEVTMTTVTAGEDTVPGNAEASDDEWLDDPTLGGIFELYTPEEYEEVVENVKKYSDGEGGDKDETVKRMEEDLEKLKADNGKGEFVIYKSAFNESYEEDGYSVSVGLNPMSIMAPWEEWRPEAFPLTAEVYEEEAERMKPIFDKAVENGTLTEEQRQRILDKIDDNIEKLKAQQ